MAEAVLVAGGAGFIGSHVSKLLHMKGYHPVVVDNLVRGHRWAVKWGSFVEGDLADTQGLMRVIRQHRIRTVMHFAAYAYVGESVAEPSMYYLNNVAGSLSLLQAMRDAGAERLIFSSSCTTYGEPRETPITEDHPQVPISPYGRSKLMVEQVLRDYEDAYGLRHVNLRYFNASGADPEGELGEVHDPETHLIPVVLDVALGRRPHVAVFGTDWDTPDGTCIRDYIHVSDLAEAHLAALERLLGGGASTSYNLGIGKGYSVREVVEEARRVTGRSIDIVEENRRPGDPAALVAGNGKAVRELGWSPRFGSLTEIVTHAWDWHRRYRGDGRE